MEIALGLDPLQGDWVPTWNGNPFFNWGSHHLYLMSVSFRVAEAVGELEIERQPKSWTTETLAQSTRIARWISVLYGLCTVFLLYRLGTRWFGSRVGLTAAAFLALTPLDVINAHFGLINTASSFWQLLALGLLVRVVDRGTRFDELSAGAALGVALAVKVSAVALLPIALFALCWGALLRSAGTSPPGGCRSRRNPRSTEPRSRLFAASRRPMASTHREPTAPRSASDARHLANADYSDSLLRQFLRSTLRFSAAAFATWLLSTPGALLEPAAYLHDVFFELFQHPRRGHGLLFERTGNGAEFLLLRNMPVALGWGLWGLSLVGLGVIGVRAIRVLGSGRWRCPSTACSAAVLLFFWVLLIGVLLASSRTRFSRYLLALTPHLCVCAAYLVWRGAAGSVFLERWVLRPAAVFTLLSSAAYSGAEVRTFSIVDPRDQARAWFVSNVPHGVKVGLLTQPTQLTPPLYPWAGNGSRRAAERRGLFRQEWTILDLDPERLRAERPDYLVFSSRRLAPALRLGRPKESELMRLIDEQYIDAAGPWRNRSELLGWDFGWKDTPVGWSPATGEVRILRRRQ